MSQHMPPHPPTRLPCDEEKRQDIGTSLERHPFSGLVHSAGELLHTP